MTRWRFAAALLAIWSLPLAEAVEAGSIPCVWVREPGGPSVCPGTETIIGAKPGDALALEIVLDTAGLSFEGYSYDIYFIPAGRVSEISLEHGAFPPPIGPFIPDLRGPPVIDDEGDMIKNINQGSLTGALPPGVYVIDIVSFVVDGLPVEVVPLLGLGGTLGLGGGSVRNAFFFSAVIPEPGTGLLLGAGISMLALVVRRTLPSSPG